MGLLEWWGYYVPSKHQEPLIHQHDITTQNTWIFRNNVHRTSNLEFLYISLYQTRSMKCPSAALKGCLYTVLYQPLVPVSTHTDAQIHNIQPCPYFVRHEVFTVALWRLLPSGMQHCIFWWTCTLKCLYTPARLHSVTSLVIIIFILFYIITNYSYFIFGVHVTETRVHVR